MRRETFEALAAHAIGGLRGSEVLLLVLEAERSDFVRFNRGRVRQAMTVEQATLGVTLIDDRRRDSIAIELSGTEADREALAAAIGTLRAGLADLAPDPYLLYATEPVSSCDIRRGVLPAPADAIGTVIDAAAGADLVGVLASGPVVRGFANSFGQRNWHEVDSTLLDWSVVLSGDRAIKDQVAVRDWVPERIAARIAASREKLPLLDRPLHPVAPGEYRTYLAPAAVAELAGMFNWHGVSTREQRTRQSPLQRLVDGELALSPLLTVREDTAAGLAPAFDEVGFVRPASVSLIAGGRHAGSLTSPRSAQEFGLPANGAAAHEGALSMAIDGGTLPEAAALAALDTGLYVSNLHYLNWSDRGEARVTGMTRFACFRVEAGRLVAPLPVMRFDDTLYRLLGSQLEALTEEPEWIPDTGTYGGRSIASIRAPGALLANMTLTL